MPWEVIAWSWLAAASVSGVVVLGLGCLAVGICRQPVVRCRLVVWTILAAVSVPWLGLVTLIPKWSVAPPSSRPAEPGSISLPLPANDSIAAGRTAVVEPPRQQ